MDKIDFSKIAKFFPSKRFATIIGISAGSVLVILIVTSYIGSHSKFSASGKLPISENSSVTSIVELDSNDNGIPDWEESLWGLDPKGNGDANKKAIASKKAAAGIDTTEPKSPANATDAFSRQLLSAVLALKQSGSLTPEAITNLAASVGNSVDAHHADPATYTINDIRLTSSSTAQAKAAYKVALKGVIDQYQDVNLGSELGIISDGLSGGGADTLAALGPIAQAYTDISKKIIALPTPPGASLYALALANTSAAMGATLVQIQNLYGDVISGMVGIDDYVKASAASDKASANMKLYFSS